MPRALTVARVNVPLSHRDAYIEGARRRREHFTASGCSFWLFQDPRHPETYTEFAEARDIATLRAALVADASSGSGVGADRDHIFTEVELT